MEDNKGLLVEEVIVTVLLILMLGCMCIMMKILEENIVVIPDIGICVVKKVLIENAVEDEEVCRTRSDGCVEEEDLSGDSLGK